MPTAPLANPSPERARVHQRREATVNIRIARETRDLIDSAAAATGKSRSEFMVDVDWQGKGLGEDLLLDAYRRTVQISEIIGIRTILVHALDEGAAKFWRRMEFLPYPTDSVAFSQPLRNVFKALR